MKKHLTQRIVNIKIACPLHIADKAVEYLQSIGCYSISRDDNDDNDRTTFREAYPEADYTTALKGARYKEDMTQKEFAEAIGISQRHLSQMENGKRPVGKELAKRIGERFNMDPRLFLSM